MDTYYADRFKQTERGSRSVYVFGQPESRVAPIMEYVERTYPGVRSYSLPSVGWQNADGTAVKPHIEFGIKAEGEAFDAADRLRMGAGGDFRHHAAEGAVRFLLAGDALGQHAAVDALDRQPLRRRAMVQRCDPCRRICGGRRRRDRVQGYACLRGRAAGPAAMMLRLRKSASASGFTSGMTRGMSSS